MLASHGPHGQAFVQNHGPTACHRPTSERGAGRFIGAMSGVASLEEFDSELGEFYCPDPQSWWRERRDAVLVLVPASVWPMGWVDTAVGGISPFMRVLCAVHVSCSFVSVLNISDVDVGVMFRKTFLSGFHTL